MNLWRECALKNLKEKFPALREWIVIETDRIVFSEDTVKACARNACGCYGTIWSCPPAVGKLSYLEKKIRAYPYVFFFSTCHELEDSFDLEGMDSARQEHTRLTEEIAEHFSVPHDCVLGAEACNICKQCTYPSAPCRFPERQRRTVESHGIDVVVLCERTGLKYCNGQNTVTYFSLLFLEKNVSE